MNPIKSFSLGSCLLALTVVVACGDGDEATENSMILPDATVTAEASPDAPSEGSTAETTVDGGSNPDTADATSSGDGDGALADGADGMAIVADAQPGPGGDGGLIL